VKDLVVSPMTATTRGTSYDNAKHLAPDFLSQVLARFEGTRLGRQEVYGEFLEIVEGQWFTSFDPARHVTAAAEFDETLPLRLAIDCGTSRFVGAVFFQVREHGPHKDLVTVCGEALTEGLYSEASARVILAKANELAPPAFPNLHRIDVVRLDPAASARSGLGPAAFGEFARVFGPRITERWPLCGVVDSLDTVGLLLGMPPAVPSLLIHPRSVNLIAAMEQFRREERSGEFLDYPAPVQHPHEDLIDALRGGILSAGVRQATPLFSRVHARQLL
jgi:hypothetical protein